MRLIDGVRAFVALCAIVAAAVAASALQASPIPTRGLAGTTPDPLLQLAREGPPHFAKGTLYRTVRARLMAEGWRPYRVPGSQGCPPGWACSRFPETLFCAGTGRAVCSYGWSRSGAYLLVYAYGEGDQVFDSLEHCGAITASRVRPFECAPLGAAASTVSGPPGDRVHVLQPSTTRDIWTTSVYSYSGRGGGPGGGLDDHELRVGGYGDIYISLIRFDLPPAPRGGRVWLELYNDSADSEPTPVELQVVTSNWSWRAGDRLWWRNRPQMRNAGTAPIDVPRRGWVSIEITDIYADWSSGRQTNFGLAFTPVRTDNRFTKFASTQASDSRLRPRLRFAAEPPQGGAPVPPSASYILPVTPTGRISGFFDQDYTATEDRQHLGVDLPVAARTTVVSPVKGTVVFNNTGSSVPADKAFLVIREPGSRTEHVLGHIRSTIQPGTTAADLDLGEPVGTVADWGANSHVHWGVNTQGIPRAVQAGPCGDWGWGRAPSCANLAQALARGWVDLNSYVGSGSATGPAAAPLGDPSVPPLVRVELNRRYPGWSRETNPGTCDPNWRSTFLTGDFNRDGAADHVIKIRQGRNIYAVALLATPNGFDVHELKDTTPDLETLGIRVLKRGQRYHDYAANRQRTLDADTIEIAACEVSSFLMVYRNGVFIPLTTSD